MLKTVRKLNSNDISTPTSQFDFDQRDKFIKCVSPKSFQIGSKMKRDEANNKKKLITTYQTLTLSIALSNAFSSRDSSSLRSANNRFTV